MTRGTETTTGIWLATTSRVLYERPERLQYLVMEIAKKTPDIGCYASDLARLRMSGLVMESMLFKLWNADSADSIDEIIQGQWSHPCAGVIQVMGNLVKNDLNCECRLQTVH